MQSLNSKAEVVNLQSPLGAQSKLAITVEADMIDRSSSGEGK